MEFRSVPVCSDIAAVRKMKSEDEDEDEDLPNTYDYNDSFISDESQSLSQTQRTHGDSDGEDIEGLKQEAKSFLKSKVMGKPVAGDV